MPEQHTRPAVECSARRLGNQRGLAHPGLTGDQQHFTALAIRDARERIQHRRHLSFPAHDTRCGAHTQTTR